MHQGQAAQLPPAQVQEGAAGHQEAPIQALPQAEAVVVHQVGAQLLAEALGKLTAHQGQVLRDGQSRYVP